jgi:hypothetical protein
VVIFLCSSGSSSSSSSCPGTRRQLRPAHPPGSSAAQGCPALPQPRTLPRAAPHHQRRRLARLAPPATRPEPLDPYLGASSVLAHCSARAPRPSTPGPAATTAPSRTISARTPTFRLHQLAAGHAIRPTAPGPPSNPGRATPGTTSIPRLHQRPCCSSSIQIAAAPPITAPNAAAIHRAAP